MSGQTSETEIVDLFSSTDWQRRARISPGKYNLQVCCRGWLSIGNLNITFPMRESKSIRV